MCVQGSLIPQFKLNKLKCLNWAVTYLVFKKQCLWNFCMEPWNYLEYGNVENMEISIALFSRSVSPVYNNVREHIDHKRIIWLLMHFLSFSFCLFWSPCSHGWCVLSFRPHSFLTAPVLQCSNSLTSKNLGVTAIRARIPSYDAANVRSRLIRLHRNYQEEAKLCPSTTSEWEWKHNFQGPPKGNELFSVCQGASPPLMWGEATFLQLIGRFVQILVSACTLLGSLNSRHGSATAGDLLSSLPN